MPGVVAALLLACGPGAGSRAGGPVVELGAELPPDAQPASLQILTGFDDEGVLTATLPPGSPPGPYFAGGTLYADAAQLARALAPSMELRLVDGVVRIGGASAEWPARLHGGVLYLPVDSLAVRLGAWPRIDPPATFATLWPAPLLCDFARRVPAAASPVLIDAAEAGLLARCAPPLDVRVTRLEAAPGDAPWAASLQFSTVVPDAEVLALLVAYDAWPYRVEMLAGTMEVVYSAEDPAAPSAVLAEAAAEARREAVDTRTAVEPMLLAARAEAVGWLEQVSSVTGRGAAPRDGQGARGAASLGATLERVRAGAPIVHAVHVVAPADRLRALVQDAAASRTLLTTSRLRIAPGVHVGDRWSVPATYAPR